MNTQLPESLKKYFWDYDFLHLNMNNHSYIITERILNYGNLKSIKWLLDQIDFSFLKQVVQTSKSLDNKTKNFWTIYLDGI